MCVLEMGAPVGVESSVGGRGGLAPGESREARCVREAQERLERWLLLPESQEQAGERELELPRRILLQDTQKLIAPCFAPKA